MHHFEGERGGDGLIWSTHNVMKYWNLGNIVEWRIISYIKCFLWSTYNSWAHNRVYIRGLTTTTDKYPTPKYSPHIILSWYKRPRKKEVHITYNQGNTHHIYGTCMDKCRCVHTNRVITLSFGVIWCVGRGRRCWEWYTARLWRTQLFLYVRSLKKVCLYARYSMRAQG